MRRADEMNDHDGDSGDGALSPELRGVVSVLREAVEPNDLWRHRLVHRLAEETIARNTERRWSLRPWVAIAAGVACMAAGGAAALLVGPQRSETPRQVTAARPLIRFTLDAPAATTVSIVGDFNGWRAGSLPLRRSSDGRTWEIHVPLPPGRYAYSFVVDGQLARDPMAPQSGGDDFGSPNSVVLVSGS
jgi:hypothetical protein